MVNDIADVALDRTRRAVRCVRHTVWHFWDGCLDFMYDVRSVCLALRYHGVPVLLVAAMAGAYLLCITSVTRVVAENRASLSVSVSGFKWVPRLTSDFASVARRATTALGRVADLEFRLGGVHVGETISAVDACLDEGDLAWAAADAEADAAIASTNDALERIGDALAATLAYAAETVSADVCLGDDDGRGGGGADDANATLDAVLAEPWRRRRLGAPCGLVLRGASSFSQLLELNVDLASDAVKFVKGVAAYCVRQDAALPGGNGPLLYASPANLLGFVCEWFKASADTTAALANATLAIYGNASDAYDREAAAVGEIGDASDASQALAWLTALPPPEVTAALEQILATASDVDAALAAWPRVGSRLTAAIQRRQICGAVSAALKHSHIWAFLGSATHAYVRAFRDASDALEALARFALEASKVTDYGARLLARGARYFDLLRDVAKWSWESASTVVEDELAVRRYARYAYLGLFCINAALIILPDMLARTATRGRKGSHFALPVFLAKIAFSALNATLAILTFFVLLVALAVLHSPLEHACNYAGDLNVLLRKATWTSLAKSGDVATALLDSDALAEAFADVDLSFDLECAMASSYYGNARAWVAGAFLAFLVQCYFFTYLNFRFYLATHYALRKVLDDGETTLLDLIVDEEDEQERKDVFKAVKDLCPKKVAVIVHESKALENRCPHDLAEKRARRSNLRLAVAMSVDAFDDAKDSAPRAKVRPEPPRTDDWSVPLGTYDPAPRADAESVPPYAAAPPPCAAALPSNAAATAPAPPPYAGDLQLQRPARLAPLPP